MINNWAPGSEILLLLSLALLLHVSWYLWNIETFHIRSAWRPPRGNIYDVKNTTAADEKMAPHSTYWSRTVGTWRLELSPDKLAWCDLGLELMLLTRTLCMRAYKSANSCHSRCLLHSHKRFSPQSPFIYQYCLFSTLEIFNGQLSLDVLSKGLQRRRTLMKFPRKHGFKLEMI